MLQLKILDSRHNRYCMYHSTTHVATTIPQLRLIHFRLTGLDWVWKGLVFIYYTKETFISLKGAFDMVFSVQLHLCHEEPQTNSERRANEYIQLCQLIFISDATLRDGNLGHSCIHCSVSFLLESNPPTAMNVDCDLCCSFQSQTFLASSEAAGSVGRQSRHVSRRPC